MMQIPARLRVFPAPRTVAIITLVASVAMLALFVWLRQYEPPLAPYGIIAYELAFSPERVTEMLTQWGNPGLEAARQSLLWDFLFMPAYATAFGGLTLIAARTAQGRLASVGLWLTLAPFGAWIMDAIENLALLSMVNAPQTIKTISAAPPLIAGIAATIKFSLLVIALGYIALRAVSLLLKRRT